MKYFLSKILAIAGLGFFCVGLVITAVGLGNRGFSSRHLQLLGPLITIKGGIL